VGARQRLAHDQRAQLGGRRVFEASAKGSDGGAYTADNNNITAHDKVSFDF
jgi:hypothetical protein